MTLIIFRSVVPPSYKGIHVIFFQRAKCVIALMNAWSAKIHSAMTRNCVWLIVVICFMTNVWITGWKKGEFFNTPLAEKLFNQKEFRIGTNHYSTNGLCPNCHARVLSRQCRPVYIKKQKANANSNSICKTQSVDESTSTAKNSTEEPSISKNTAVAEPSDVMDIDHGQEPSTSKKIAVSAPEQNVGTVSSVANAIQPHDAKIFNTDSESIDLECGWVQRQRMKKNMSLQCFRNPLFCVW